jgi:tetratricopeptide (TPR) repeat protein
MKTNTFDQERDKFLYEAETLLRENNLSGALNIASGRLKEYPSDSDAYAVLCSALIGLGRVEEAREALLTFGESISDMFLAYEQIGDVYRQKGFHQDAAACYEKLLASHPEAQKAREVIGKMILLEQNDNPLPEAEVGITFEKNIPEPELFTVTMADLYIQQGHFPEAMKILEDVVQNEPHNKQAAEKLQELKISLAREKTDNEEYRKTDKLIKTLSLWLKNIERLKRNAAEKK